MITKKDSPLTFWEHLEELRGRIVFSLLALLAAACLFYRYVGDILPLLIKPVGKVVFTSPTEAFMAHFMLALFGGMFFAMPVILYQLWRFVATALNDREKRYVFIFVPGVFAFFSLGCVFGYFVLLPTMLQFLLSFETSLVVPMIGISRYISFVCFVVAGCGIAFELPLVIVFLTQIGIVTPAFLIHKRKHAIVAIFIASAVLTPSPDFFSQLVLAVPLVLLYEISIIFSKMISWANARKVVDQRRVIPSA